MSLPDIPKINPAKFTRSRLLTKKFIPLILVVALVVFFAIFHAFLSGPTEVVKTIFPQFLGVKSTDGRVNILLLGMAGGRHDGANLTDTIIVASYNLKNNQVHLISIPRDLWVPSDRSKVNAIYESGLASGNGLDLSKTVIGNIVGLPIHYGLRLDFNGFEKAIDTLGGVEVDVENGFDDYLYPITGKENNLCDNKYEDIEVTEPQAKELNITTGKQKLLILADGKIATDSAESEKGFKYFKCRYEHLTFDKGKRLMNGETALKFVRSRHGTGGEGSDFARSKRQQKVIDAAREKVLSLETLGNPGKISELISTFSKSIDTDVKVSEILEFYKLSRGIKKTETIVLDNSIKKDLPDDRKFLLYNPPAGDYGGAYVLISQDDDYSFIQKYIMQKLQEEVKGEATTSARPGN